MPSKRIFRTGIVTAGMVTATVFATNAAYAAGQVDAGDRGPAVQRMGKMMDGNPGMQRMHELHMQGHPGMQRMHERHMQGHPGMQRMHERHMQGNPGMQRMHELHMQGNPGMQRMHDRMMGSMGS